MANGLLAKNGLIVTGSIEVQNAVTASTFSGDGSGLSGVSDFPYTGSAVISGSLDVKGGIIITGSNTLSSEYSLAIGNPSSNNLLLLTNAGKLSVGRDPFFYMPNGSISAYGIFYSGTGGNTTQPAFYIGSNQGGAGRGFYGTGQGIGVSVNNAASYGFKGSNSTNVNQPSSFGIGMDAPSALLDIKYANTVGGAQGRNLVRISGSADATHAEAFLISNSGNTGIGTWSPNYKLEVVGDVSASTYYGDGSNLTGISSDPFPYTGSAVISGSLTVSGSTSLEGNLDLNSNSITAVDNISTSTSNVKLGDISGTTGGANSVYIGSRPMWQKSGNEVVAIGSGVFRHSTSSPGASVGIGSGASSYNRGTNSVVVGKDAFLGNSLSPSTSGNNVVVIGYQAAKAAEGVDGVTAIGYQALTSLTTGTGNTALGYKAGDNITTGINNVHIGYEAGDNNHSKTVLIGYQAKSANDNAISIGWLTRAGNSSTSVGTLAGANGGTGQENVYIGDSSGRFNTGLRNVFIGRNAGYDSGTSSNNVFIGWRAGYDETDSNRLHIDGSNNSTTPLIYGEFDNDLVRINGKLYVSNSLDVTGSVSASTYYGDGSNLTGISSDPFPYTGSAVISGSLTLTGSFNALLPTSSTDTYFVTYNTASYELEARQVATLINPKVEYLDVTASISSGTSITLPNGLSYISSSTYEYLEVFFNGLRLRYDRDFVPTSTTTIQNQITFPSGSELTFKSLKA